ncbi:MAG: hypothetical protein JNN07_19235 [Verrucomicrobiales bacterium]|nr:hypothetical protein [Verrucomicrobiales bacterium]
MDESTLALLIPIIAIVMGCSIPMLLFFFEYLKKKQLYSAIHQERVAAIDKGLDLPPWPEGLFRNHEVTPHPRRYLRRGLIWVFVGISLGISIYYGGKGSPQRAIFGLIPFAIGLANLIYYRMEGRNETADWEKERAKEERKAAGAAVDGRAV